MKNYAVVYEWAGSNYSAYIADLPGCVSTGQTLEDARANKREAVEGHLAVMRECNEAIPEPTTVVEDLRLSTVPLIASDRMPARRADQGWSRDHAAISTQGPTLPPVARRRTIRNRIGVWHGSNSPAG